MIDRIILTEFTKEEIVNDILKGIAEILEKSKTQDIQSKEWLTAKEVQKMLKISAVTLWKYDSKGITKPHKIGSRKRYCKSDIVSIIQEIEVTLR